MEQRSRAAPRWRERTGWGTEEDEVTAYENWKRGKCFSSWMRLKEGIVPASLWGEPHQSHRLATDSIDHFQSFIPPIKMLSVHITFVFLWWTQLLLHKDIVVINIQFYHFWLLCLWFLWLVVDCCWKSMNITQQDKDLTLTLSEDRKLER